jgi:hypothetical protein
VRERVRQLYQESASKSSFNRGVVTETNEKRNWKRFPAGGRRASLRSHQNHRWYIVHTNAHKSAHTSVRTHTYSTCTTHPRVSRTSVSSKHLSGRCTTLLANKAFATNDHTFTIETCYICNDIGCQPCISKYALVQVPHTGTG